MSSNRGSRISVQEADAEANRPRTSRTHSDTYSGRSSDRYENVRPIRTSSEQIGVSTRRSRRLTDSSYSNSESFSEATTSQGRKRKASESFGEEGDQKRRPDKEAFEEMSPTSQDAANRRSIGEAEKDQPVRASSRIRRPTLRLKEMMETEKILKHPRRESIKREAAEDNEEIVVDVITADAGDRFSIVHRDVVSPETSMVPPPVEREEILESGIVSRTDDMRGTMERHMEDRAIGNQRADLGADIAITEENVIVDEEPIYREHHLADDSEGPHSHVVPHAMMRDDYGARMHARTTQIQYRHRPHPTGYTSDRPFIPAAAPLLTTDRTNTRVIKRMKPEEREAKEAADRLAAASAAMQIARSSERRRFSSGAMRPLSPSMHAMRPSEDRRSFTSAYQFTTRHSRNPYSHPDDSGLMGRTGRLRTSGISGRYSEASISRGVEGGEQIIVTEDGEEVIYEPINEDEAIIAEEQVGGEEGEMLFSEEQLEGPIQNSATMKTTTTRKPNVPGIKVEKLSKSEKGAREEGGDEEDDAPPQLVPEEGPGPEEIMQMEQMEKGTFQETEFIDGMGEVVRVQSPGGTQQYVQLQQEDAIYVDENGTVLEEPTQQDLRAVEFNFLDSKNICCGLCGEIVPYDLLMSEHLPMQHPEVIGDDNLDLEEIPYEIWLRDKLNSERKQLENGFRPGGYESSRIARSTRTLRRVSQVRVNPNEMTLPQLDTALKKKMIEKMGRKVPVALVDKQHARCGICNAVVSLNRKFEVVHLVRHFNAWHPSAHRCAGTWKDRQQQPGQGKPLSMQDFAVVDTALEGGDNIQCIWCGMFMDSSALAMHFSELHPDDVEVPKCNLCLQELVMNARLTEKYGDDFMVSLPDEHHIRCGKFETTHTSEPMLDRAIEKRLKRIQMMGESGEMFGDEDDDENDEELGNGPEAYLNSRMSFGRRSKPKRHFIMPALRQAAPIGSRFVEPVTECHWKCKLCGADILAAVISAGAIRHFHLAHPEDLKDMQYELCKARLERVSDGCMEFVHPQLIECLVCNMTYPLHKPFNMCRAIRHLKSKHPDVMPEYAGTREQERQTLKSIAMRRRRSNRGDEANSGYITDPETIASLKEQYNVEFERVQALEGANGERVYVLMAEGEEVDQEMVAQLAASIAEEGSTQQHGESRLPSERSNGQKVALETEGSEQPTEQFVVEPDEDHAEESQNELKRGSSSERQFSSTSEEAEKA